MPWDSRSFAQRHNHSLHGEKAAHASRIANAVLRSGQPDGLAIAIANRWAQRHRRAAGGGVDTSATDAQMAAYNAIAQAHAGAGAYAQGMVGGGGQSPQMPPMATPSYLAGTAGSPVDTSALPQYRPQVPQSMGINSAGLMNVPQTGDFYLDPTTGAMSGASQAALKALAQRGLQIGAPAAAAGAPGAGGAGPAPIIGQGGSGPEGAGNSEAAGNAGNSGGGGGPQSATANNSSTMDIIGGRGPSLNPSFSSAKDYAIAAALGLVTGGPMGAVAGLAGRAGRDIIGGIDLGTAQDAGAQPVAGDLGINALGAGIESGQDMGDITGGGNARGGRIGRAAGGALSPSMASPWWTRSEARAGEHPSGLVVSPIGGRSDHIPMSLGAGSYVVPSDVMGGIGQGNNLSGAHQFDQMIHAGPYGTKMPIPKMHGTLPKPPSMPQTVAAHHFSRGGATKGRVPVIVAGGERIVSPEEVAALSGGDIEKGHRLLDDWVVRARKAIIETMKRLPGPVK